MRRIVRFLIDESGPTSVEYGIMLALIIIVCFSTISTLGGVATDSFSATASALENAAPAGS